MAKLDKIVQGMSCFGHIHSRGAGRVLLADCRTFVEDFVLQEGDIVKDVIDKICQSMENAIVPVVRPLFTLCDVKTGHALCHSHQLNAFQAEQCYQLRVFVNAGDNSSCLKKYSRAAKNYYYMQLKTDFITGKLRKHMAAANIGLQMAAIDMVHEALERNLTTYEEIIARCKFSQFMPSYLKEQQAWQETLAHLFEECFNAMRHSNTELVKVQYIYAYERDLMCGSHLFQAKIARSSIGTTERFIDSRLHVSWKKGLVLQTRVKREEYYLSDILSLKVDFSLSSVILSLTDKFDVTHSPIEWTLSFKVFGELLTFCAVIDAYFRLKIDVNTCILEKDIKNHRERLKEYLGREVQDICHGPISKESADKVFEDNGMVEGLYLIRESRSKDFTFILSLCQREGVFNYRISYGNDRQFILVDQMGMSPIPHSFYTLNDLISHHHHFTDGLPTLLRHNCTPSETGPIPLFPDPSRPESIQGSLGELEDDSEIIKDLVANGVKRIHYRKELKLIDELGSGHFSSVHSAEWKEPGKDVRRVAIKIPTFPQQSSKAQDVLDEMRREIMTMYQLDHQYITKLLAVTDERHHLDTIGRFPMIVMEYIDGGSLRSVLNKFRPPSNQRPPEYWQSRYLRYSQQIAEGMAYLGVKNVVHRDLATRNVLVVSETHVKISDFGLARQFVDNSDYYKSTRRTDLPVYWYAPECLLSLRFSSASDVWSFGVTIWEVFTLGRRPQEFLERIVTKAQSDNRNPLEALTRHFQQNSRLPCFPECPHSIYQLMKQTWNIDPAKRPNFDRLSSMLNDELEKFAPSLLPSM